MKNGGDFPVRYVNLPEGTFRPLLGSYREHPGLQYRLGARLCPTGDAGDGGKLGFGNHRF